MSDSSPPTDSLPTGSLPTGSLPTGYVRACTVADVADGEVVSVEIDGEPVAVVRTEGEYYACRDVCSHQEIPLSEGDVEGTTIECWLHGSRFDLITGRPTGLPATEPVPVYPVKIDGDDVLVSVRPNQES